MKFFIKLAAVCSKILLQPNNTQSLKLLGVNTIILLALSRAVWMLLCNQFNFLSYSLTFMDYSTCYLVDLFISQFSGWACCTRYPSIIYKYECILFHPLDCKRIDVMSVHMEADYGCESACSEGQTLIKITCIVIYSIWVTEDALHDLNLDRFYRADEFLHIKHLSMTCKTFVDCKVRFVVIEQPHMMTALCLVHFFFFF